MRPEAQGPQADEPSKGKGGRSMDVATREWLTKIESKLDSALSTIATQQTQIALLEQQDLHATSHRKSVEAHLQDVERCVDAHRKEFREHTTEEKVLRAKAAGVAAAIGAIIATIPTVLHFFGIIGAP